MDEQTKTRTMEQKKKRMIMTILMTWTTMMMQETMSRKNKSIQHCLRFVQVLGSKIATAETESWETA
jgi:hypothetical protein